MGKRRNNPFRPGTGKAPPHRAGHEDAERQLTEMMRLVADKEDNDMVVLYGPRGTGKTVLLTVLEKQAARLGVKAHALNPSSWGKSSDAFVKRLASGVIDKSQFKGEFTISAIFTKMKIVYDPALVDMVAEEVLRRMTDAGPVALLVDEAHRLSPDIAECLLSAAQACIRNGLPLLLVLAGTPGLRASLSHAHASLWERSVRLGIGRLESRDATRAALSLPAKRRGLPFADDALELLAAESQDYPFFIQLLGKWAWEAAIARDPNADRIGLEDAQAGIRMANKERHGLYKDRLQEVNNRKILSEAVAASKAFAKIDSDGVLSTAKLGAALRPALTGNRTVHDAIQELFALGLVWETDESGWMQGIPSPCAFLKEHAVVG